MRLAELTDLELLSRYGRLCGEVELAAEYGLREERERELRVERDRLGVEILSRMARASDRAETPEPGHVYSCCGKTGRISRHESWCPVERAHVASLEES